MDKLKVLFAASECYPFAKSGGLGDVVGALPKAFPKDEVDVRVILPKYESIPWKFVKEFEYLTNFWVKIGQESQYVGLFKYEYEGITYYFVDNEHYFKRPNLYGYYDDAERYIYFSRAVLEAIPYLDFYPDVIHAHDWQTALIPFLLKEQYAWHYTNTKTVFTIHNIKYQGEYGFDDVKGILNLDYFPAQMEFYKNVNFMKGAMYTADLVTTVSPSYAEEIKDPYYGEGLDGVARDISWKEIGILNGIDEQTYNPQTDESLFVPYARSQKKKAENKAKLQEYLGLPVRPEVPILAIITRLVDQKGIDLIMGVIHDILQMDIQFIVLGTGDADYENKLKEVAYSYPDKMRAIIDFNEDLSRKIYAGADMFLIPSKFEPCGLTQMIAMRYGTIPIVRETGGLKDSVQYYNNISGEGNGFSFKTYNAHDMLFTIQKAVGMYYDQPDQWKHLMDNAFNTHYDWRLAADIYEYWYRKITGRL
ncbi:MAG: glycogen synthase GlgA [Eubacteriaceae bacterium]|jgi:starch synthase